MASESSSTVELETVPCPSCGEPRHAPVLEAADPLDFGPGRWSLVRCSACTLAYVRTRPTEAAMARFYPEAYEPYAPKDDEADGAAPDRLARAWLNVDLGYPPQPPGLVTRLLAALARRRLSARQRQRHLPWVEGGRLLDVGPGAGRYLATMRTLGWRVEGLEASPAAAEAITSRTGIPVHVGSLPHPALAPRSFHAVTLWAALEHLHRPREALEAARELLVPGGTLALSVPNFASWSSGAFGIGWYGLDLPRHLTHFTPETLEGLARRAGFEGVVVTQVGRAGWIRRSVKRAEALGVARPDHAAWRSGAASRRRAAQTEREGAADSLRLLAHVSRTGSDPR